jgi:hypothetical protein
MQRLMARRPYAIGSPHVSQDLNSPLWMRASAARKNLRRNHR